MMVVFSIISLMFLCFFFRLPSVCEEVVESVDDKHPPRFTSPVVASTGNEISIEVCNRKIINNC